MKRIVACLAGLLLLAPCLRAEFLISSSFPVDATVGMEVEQHLSLTFNAPLDTTRRYIFNGHDEILLPVRVLIAEPDAGLVVQGWEWHAASLTLTLHMQWEPDTEYFLLVDRARDNVGHELALPVDLHLSTGPDWGPRTVGCQVLRLDGGSLTGLVVALFDQPPMWAEDPHLGAAAVVLGEDGLVDVPFVRPGVWYPVAAGDADDDGHLDPQCGDPFGYLDQDGDGMPDSVVVEDEDLFGLVIPLSSMSGCTARMHLEQAASLAEAFTQDPAVQLKAVLNQSESLDDGGQCTGWSYEFWSSASQRQVHVHFTADVPQVEEGDGGVSFPPMATLPAMFVDSDIALCVALNNGGRDLEAQLTESTRQAWVGNFHWMWANPQAMLWAITFRGWTEGGQWRQHLFLVDAQTGAFLGDFDTALPPQDPPAGQATDLTLGEAWPNPFNASCVVPVRLGRTAEILLELFDVRGRLVAPVARGTFSAGEHVFRVDAAPLPSGLYLLRLASAGQTHTRPLLLLR